MEIIREFILIRQDFLFCDAMLIIEAKFYYNESISLTLGRDTTPRVNLRG